MKPKLTQQEKLSKRRFKLTQNEPKEDLNWNKSTQNEPKQTKTGQSDTKGDLNWPRTTQSRPKRREASQNLPKQARTTQKEI